MLLKLSLMSLHWGSTRKATSSVELIFFTGGRGGFVSESITLTTTTSSPSSSLVPSCWKSHQGRSWASTSAAARRRSWGSSYPRCLSVLLWVFVWGKLVIGLSLCVCVLAGGPWLRCSQGRSSGRRSSSLCEWCWFPRHRALQSKSYNCTKHCLCCPFPSCRICVVHLTSPFFVYFQGSGNSEDCTRNPHEGSLFPIQ